MRKRKPKLRMIIPDPRYNDPMVTQFVNNLMWEGKKSTALTLFYEALDLVADRTKQDEHGLWKKALNNVMPQVLTGRSAQPPDWGRHLPDPDGNPRQAQGFDRNEMADQIFPPAQR